MPTDVKTSLVAITGALGDIGSAIANSYTERGITVERSDLKEVDAVEASLRERYCQVDVSDEASINAWYAAMIARNGQVPDVVIVNAGIVRVGAATELSTADWQSTINVNLTGAWLTAAIGARHMKDGGIPGNIVFVGSWVGQYPVPALAAYCASKAALHSLNQTMALELAPQGIRVNEVAPGYVDAGLSRELFEKDPGLKERAINAVPLRSLVSAEEVARAVLFLTNPDNSNATGSTITLDGGLSLMHGPQNTAPQT